jgi:hypothetical protein
MSRRQGGQALVGALVVTTLAFLMAGAVAVGASALLSQESNRQNASSRDLAAQDALAAAVAGVAGQGRANGSAPCSQPTSFNTSLPSGYVSQALCLRADGVSPGSLTLIQLPWSRGCAVVDVSGYSQNHVLLWFSAYANVSAWVDESRSGCSQGRPICAASGRGPIAQVLLDCDLAASQEAQENNGDLFLHVQNPAQSPVLVRLAQYASSGGSIYVLAANTGLVQPAFEEADIWVSSDGTTTALRFEGTL